MAGFHPPLVSEPSSSRSTSKTHLNYVEQNYGTRLWTDGGGKERGGVRRGEIEGGGERACEKRGLTPARGSQLPARGWRETWESRSNRVVTGNRFRSDEIYSS